MRAAKRVFATDVLVCDTCGGAMRILAALPAGDASGIILEHLGLPTKPPPARALHQVSCLTTPDPPPTIPRPPIHVGLNACVQTLIPKLSSVTQHRRQDLLAPCTVICQPSLCRVGARKYPFVSLMRRGTLPRR
jgi:hypothetical protein